MINNLYNHLPPTIDTLHQSNIEFTLTGSRFFYPLRAPTPPCDWDLFTVDNNVTKRWLSLHGFKLMTTNSLYRDCATTGVYQYSNDEYAIDVQLIRDAQHYYAKKIVQDMIRAYGLERYIDKHHTNIQDCTKWWSMLIKLVALLGEEKLKDILADTTYSLSLTRLYLEYV